MGGNMIDNNFDFAGTTMRATALLEQEQQMLGFHRAHNANYSGQTAAHNLSSTGSNKSHNSRRGDYHESHNGNRFDLDEMLARDTATLTLDYQDLMQASSKRPAYAALWDDAPRGQSPVANVPAPSRSSATSGTPSLEPNMLSGNIWGTGYDAAQRQEAPNAQVPAWGTPTMSAGVPPMDRQYGSPATAMGQLPQTHMPMHQTVSPHMATQSKPPLSLQILRQSC
ncbi:hypothetical protein BDF19DRAFT_296822 [Syncephalis fuscata]|nr:hypothetical protein BDF19DRAFT_296822 [Syncephalis fuscata]